MDLWSIFLLKTDNVKLIPNKANYRTNLKCPL